MISTTLKKMHLIEDEEIVEPVRGEPETFRLRVWRAKDCPAAVLVSQIEGHAKPQIISAKLANHVYRVYLGFLDLGMDYFEWYGERLYLVTFDWISHGDRKQLIRPNRTECEPSDLSILVGAHVEL